jgi:transposase-like protein
MAGKRKQYDTAFKAKAALEAARSVMTLAKLAIEHQLPSPPSIWGN